MDVEDRLMSPEIRKREQGLFLVFEKSIHIIPTRRLQIPVSQLPVHMWDITTSMYMQIDNTYARAKERHTVLNQGVDAARPTKTRNSKPEPGAQAGTKRAPSTCHTPDVLIDTIPIRSRTAPSYANCRFQMPYLDQT